MNILKTTSFELAVYVQGDMKAERLFLCLPGRLDTKDYIHMKSHVDYFAQKGFLALSFDPPGTWESPGDISLYTVPNYVKAINEVIEHYGNRPTVVFGHSRGGTMGMLAGIHNEHITHMISAMSYWGPSTKPAHGGDIHVSRRDLPPGDMHTNEQKIFNLPMSYFDDATIYSGLEACAKPKMFFAGNQDDLITVDDVTETFQEASEPKQMCVLNVAHDYRLSETCINEINTRTAEFLGV